MKLVLCICAALAATAGAAYGFASGAWSAPVSVEAAGADPSLNSAALEGCPSVAKSGLRLYFASNRPGGYGGLDIWVARRDRVDDPWGAPENLGPTINTAADEFCPSPLRNGHGFLFVSAKPGGCGGSDIYVTREGPHGWATPRNLGCGVNSAADEASPFLLPDDGGSVLYFSSLRAGGYAPDAPGAVAGDSDIYVAPQLDDWTFGTPSLAPGLNTASSDARPNLRRDGLEIFFDSNRAGGSGSFDLYTASRASKADAWNAPVNLGPGVNSAAADTRASLSWDATTLYFGSARAGGEGSADLYMTTRGR